MQGCKSGLLFAKIAMDFWFQVSGVRCQWLRFRINDTVNSTLAANKFFVFILNCTQHTLRITG
jgi:hypothetical protein